MNFFASRTEATKDDWQTPLELIRSLGEFELDPCANVLVPTRLAQRGMTHLHDGLALSWEDWRAFVNPPYGRKARAWLRKLGEHGNGIALIPPRLGAKWFHDIVLSKADAILFLRGRVAFIDPNTGSPVKGNNADSILIAYGEDNVRALERCGLDGKLWKLERNAHERRSHSHRQDRGNRVPAHAYCRGLCRMSGDSTPTLERVALAVGDKLGGFDGAGEFYRNNGDVRWKQSLEIARAALDASGNDELVEALRKCAAKFRDYERHHQAEAERQELGQDTICKARRDKAQRNREMAEMCEAAIARTQEQSDG